MLEFIIRIYFKFNDNFIKKELAPTNTKTEKIGGSRYKNQLIKMYAK